MQDTIILTLTEHPCGNNRKIPWKFPAKRQVICSDCKWYYFEMLGSYRPMRILYDIDHRSR